MSTKSSNGETLRGLVDTTRPEMSAHSRERLCALTILGLDPGETTGWCRLRVRDGGENEMVCDYGEVKTDTIINAADKISRLIISFRPDVVVAENYLIYSWKSDQHKWNAVHTARVIGCIETLCAIQARPIPVSLQMAQHAKGFCTDDKLKSWGVYPVGEKHARDAVRHACFYLLFNKDAYNVHPQR